MLAACQTFADAPPEERINIRACLRIAQTVELPLIKASTDARKVIARYRAALIEANANIDDTKACMTALDRADNNGYF
jgi:hypothetical protein